MKFTSKNSIAFAVAASFAGGSSSFAVDAVPVKIQIDTQTVINQISPEFVGFGYETSAAAQPDFFSVKNTKLVNLYRNLSTHGLIRIGGIISDHTSYQPDGVPIAHSQKDVTVINQKSLADLGEFAKATGWRVMWGLNLGTGTADQAAVEAVDVNAALGSQLQSFEIGNEVDGLARFKKNYDTYHATYQEFKSAVRTTLPHADFSGPDGYGPLDWVINFAKTESTDIKLFTIHYYIGGAGDPSTTIEKMLKHDDGLENRLKKLQRLRKDTNVPFRINETNSFFNGGKPGVSDTFASALWCLDYMYQLATYGANGVNIETDINQHDWVSHYSPMVHDADGNWTAKPDYYGMLAFSLAGKGDLLKVTLDKSDLNLSAYATRQSDGSCWITVINKDLDRDVAVEIALPQEYSTGEIFHLTGPSADAKDKITLANTLVKDDGTWAPGEGEKIEIKHLGVTRLQVPHASAVVLRLSH